MQERTIGERENAEDVFVDNSTVQGIRMELNDGVWQRADVGLLRELPLAMFVNGKELVTILCTPSKLNCLVVGFLHLEGIISSFDEIELLRVCEEDNVAEVRTGRSDIVLPTRRTLTAGCGGGVALESEWEHLPEVRSTLTIESKQVQSLSKQLLDASGLYRSTGGVHTTALASPSNLIVVAEDVGRHNTIDKIHGECLLTGAGKHDGHILLTTGRISSEMLVKAVKMSVPIVISRSAPTDRAVRIAQAKGVTLIGYARGLRMSVYTHAWRLTDCPFKDSEEQSF